MYNQVLFYNHYGAGDIFESREFVKAWMKLVPANKYCYSHGKHPSILKDIPEIEFKEITPHMKSMTGVWDDLNGNLYVNTWIGRDGKYVLPGIGCTVEKLFQMHNDMLAVYNLGILPGNAIDYIPDINYNKYDVANVTDFVMNKRGELIFIDNGNVQSSQAENFDFHPIILNLAHKYQDKIFIVTHPVSPSSNYVPENIFYTGDIIKNYGGVDLNEVSYLSTYCSTLIGRNSGPHVFSQVRTNVMDENKRLVSFTYEQQGSSFVVNTPVKIKKFWFPCRDVNEVYKNICEVLG